MKVRIKLFSIVLSLLLLTGCAVSVDPNARPRSASYRLEPEAGQWQTWVLASGDALRPAPPPGHVATLVEIAELKELAAQRDAAAEAQMVYWDTGAPSYRWLAIAYAEHAKAQIGPSPRLARGISMMNVAIYDATVAAWDAKYAYNRPHPSEIDATLVPALDVPDSPSYPSEHAVAAGAASTILSYLFPDSAATFAAQAEEAAHSRLMAGVHYPSDVEAGLALGRAVAEKVIERAKTDGSDVAWDGTKPNGPGYWIGENPVQPTAGSWKPWVMTSGSQVRPPAPPAYDSEQMQIELTALKSYTPTFASNAAAYFWQSPPGSARFTVDTINRLIFEYRLDRNPPQAARIYATTTVAQYDAFIGCYDAKYTYWSARPSHIDPEIKTLLPNPNFPSYPSAHSCQSMAVATVLASFFPADAEAVYRAANEAGDSRMWAMIHFQSDIDAGEALGEAVARLVLERDTAMVQPDAVVVQR